MKKVDSNNGVWVNDDPTTLTNGTPIDADFMNNIQDEISNVITDNGNTLDGSNHRQLSQTLDKTFAKLNSPTLTGIPLTSNPDGTINNQIATVDYVNQRALQATVGFTPTQQGGGTDQGANKIYIGGDSTDATQARVQVDQTDLGKIVFQQDDSVTHGVDKVGYTVNDSTFAFRTSNDKAWHFSYTKNQIDEKSYISSLPTGDNVKVTDIIWNSSSSLPALYYGTNNNVEYLATTDWTEGRYIRSPAVPATDYRIQTISRNRASGGIFALAEDGSNTQLQPAGDYATNTALTQGLAGKQPVGHYATNTALSTESSSRASADTNLQNQINNAATAITNLQNSKQNNLGFTPVQQGGGAYQQANKVYLGWDGGGLRCQVGSYDLGQLARVSQLPISPSDKILRFTVSAIYGSNITFPEAFSSNNYTLSMTAQLATDNNMRDALVCNWDVSSKTNTGFKIYISWQNSGGAGSYRIYTNVDIIAIGPK